MSHKSQQIALSLSETFFPQTEQQLVKDLAVYRRRVVAGTGKKTYDSI